MILACNNITKSFGEKEILHGVSFHINDNEKAAIVGINGAGKSTLFKIIVGELSSDTGEVTFSKGSTYGYLSQHQDLTSENTIYEELLSTKADILRLEESIRSLEQEGLPEEGIELRSVHAQKGRAVNGIFFEQLDLSGVRQTAPEDAAVGILGGNVKVHRRYLNMEYLR